MTVYGTTDDWRVCAGGSGDSTWIFSRARARERERKSFESKGEIDDYRRDVNLSRDLSEMRREGSRQRETERERESELYTALIQPPLCHVD